LSKLLKKQKGDHFMKHHVHTSPHMAGNLKMSKG